MVGRKSFDSATLTHLREIPARDALVLVATDVKIDPTFVPVKNNSSMRWHVYNEHGDFEILTTGPKWYDTRANKGGGGAIDLAMHMLQLSFVDAVKYLTSK